MSDIQTQRGENTAAGSKYARRRRNLYHPPRALDVVPGKWNLSIPKIDIDSLTSAQHVAMLSAFTLISTLLFFLPYLHAFDVFYRYWDGPNYVWVAKSFYNTPVNHPLSPYGTTPAYFACHLPFYPILIRLFSFIGYLPAMILVTVLSAWAGIVAFYFFLKDTKLVDSPFWTASFLLFLPTRYLLYRTVGATEPLFILMLILSMHAFYRDRLTLSFLLASLAGITRITGILLIPVYLILLIHRKRWREIPKLAIIGLPLLATFAFYYEQFGDFWAYFSWNHGLMHAIPADIMRVFAYTPDGRSAEFFIAIYAIYGAAVLRMRKIDTNLFAFGVVFFVFSIFIFHGDLSRYFIPLAPFTFLIAFDPILKTKEFKIAYLFLIIPLTYVYSFGQLQQNLAADWVFQNLKNALGG